MTQLFGVHRGFAKTYYDDIFLHIRASNGRSDVNNNINHLRSVLECMPTNKLYASASKYSLVLNNTVDHPQTDDQTERLNYLIGDSLRSVCDITPKTWSSLLSVVEVAFNKDVHASTGFTEFYVSGLTHSRVPFTQSLRSSGLGGGEMDVRFANIRPAAVHIRITKFLATR